MIYSALMKSAEIRYRKSVPTFGLTRKYGISKEQMHVFFNLPLISVLVIFEHYL